MEYDAGAVGDVVRAAWQEVLGDASPSPGSRFVDSGGDSLAATGIAARLQRRLGRRVLPSALFETGTLGELIDHVRALPVDLAPPTLDLVDRARADLPLSHSQERMWFLHELDAKGAAYNIVDAVRFDGDLDVEALRRAVGVVAARHESMRTRYGAAAGEPRQTIGETVQVELDVVDLDGVTDADSRLAAVIRDTAEAPFDLGDPPLARLRLVRLGPDAHVLVTCIHHILADQWSLGLLYEELASAYADVDATTAGVVQDVDHAAWQRADVERLVDHQLAYWTEQLRGAPDVELPTDRPRPAVKSSRGGNVVAALPEELFADVDALARAEGATTFMVTFAAFAALVGRYAQLDDVVIGTAMANRTTPESEQVMSSLVNTVVLRTDLSGEPTFRELIAAVRRTTLEALDHQGAPFAQLVGALQPARDPSRSPLFQLFFNVQNAPFDLPRLGDVTTSAMIVDREAAQFDLSMSLDLTMSRLASLEYNADLFDRARIERMLGHYWTLLGAAVATPDASVAELSLLTDAELRELDEEWGAVEVERSPVTVVDLVAAQVERSPDRVALRAGDVVLTYAELDRRARRLASSLVAAGVGRGDLVGIHLERSADMVAAVLAVWHTGAAYVPLDPAFPADRLAYMVDDAGLASIVTERSLCGAGVTELVATVVVDDLGDDVPDVALPGPADPEALAYVLYTSGSTGRPKGVQLEHRTVVNFLAAMAARPGLVAADVLASVTTLSFDISVLELCLPLVTGAEIVLVDRDTAVDGEALGRLLDTAGVTVMQATPTTWRLLLDAGWGGRRSLTALCGGEPMPRALADELVVRCAALWNMYGPTETTVWSAAHRVGLGSGPVPIGTAIDNTRLYVLDRHRRLLPTGVPGELYIGGDVLARGYLHRPELTAERFVADSLRGIGRMYRTGDVVARREDGELEFLGRVDTQVKLRGHRIELGEIESVLNEHPSVRAAVVAVVDVAAGDSRLVGYVIPSDAGQPFDPESLRAHLRDAVPDYMVPSTYVAMDRFPLTPNNKVDRAALPSPEVSGERRIAAPPQTATEAEVARIWADVLGVDAISRDDDFFALGGHSLLAVRAFAKVKARTGRSIPLSALFRAPTVAGFAALVDATEPVAPRWTSLVEVRAEGSRPPLFYVSPFLITALSFSHLARSLDEDQPFYVLQPQGMESDDAIHQRVEDMAAHYIREMKTVQPVGPYRLGGHCGGSWVAFEMARQLRASGDEVATLVLVDSEPPNIEPPKVGPITRWVGRLRHYWRTGRVLQAVRWKVSVRTERILIRRLGDAQQRRVAELRRVHAGAHAGYRAATNFDGDAVLVRTTEWTQLPDKAWHLRWAELVDGELDVVTIPSSHAALVEPVYADLLAAAIDGALSRA